MSKLTKYNAKRTSRADLLWAMSDGADGELLDIAAQLSGFKPPLKPKISLKLPPLPETVTHKRQPTAPKPPPSETNDNQPHYYRVIERKPSDILPEPVEGKSQAGPEWLHDSTLFDPNSVVPLAVTPPDKEALVPWAKLWPVLRDLLSEQAQTRKPDIPELVRIVANGHWLERIPRKRRQRWTAQVQVLVDRPERTCLFNQDYSHLLEQLKQLRGTTGLELQRWMRQPGGRVRVERGKQHDVQDWQVPDAGTTVFILSDLGLLDESGIAQRAWVRVGKQLRLAGCRAVVLLPLPERYLVPEMVALFGCISWDRGSSLQQTRYVLPADNTLPVLVVDSKYSEDLLAWLSPAMRVEPALLRAVRHQLSTQHFDVGREIAAWHHEGVERSRIGFHLQPQKATIEKYRQRFKALCKAEPERAKSIADLIVRYHRHVFPTQRYEEVLLLAALMGDACPIPADEIEKAREHMRQLIKAGWNQADELAGIRPFLMHLIDRQHDDVVRENDFYQVVWGVKRGEAGELKGALPEGFDPKNVLALVELPQGERREYVLFQEGLRSLQLGSRERFVRGDKDGWTTGGELAAFHTTSAMVLKQKQSVGGGFSDQVLELGNEETIALPLAEKEIQRVHVAGEELAIERFVKPEWAVSIGQDERGLFVESQDDGGRVTLYWNPSIYEDDLARKKAFKPGHWYSKELGIQGWGQNFNWLKHSARNLRVHQKEAAQAALRAISYGSDRLLVRMASGAGKTIAVVQVIENLRACRWNLDNWFIDRYDRDMRLPRILILSDRRDLLFQWLSFFQDTLFFREGELRPLHDSFDVQQSIFADDSGSIFFSTIQLLMQGLRNSNSVMEEQFFSENAFFDLIVIDECHRGFIKESGAWSEVLRKLGGVQIALDGRDSRMLEDYFGAPVFVYTSEDSIASGQPQIGSHVTGEHGRQAGADRRPARKRKK